MLHRSLGSTHIYPSYCTGEIVTRNGLKDDPNSRKFLFSVLNFSRNLNSRKSDIVCLEDRPTLPQGTHSDTYLQEPNLVLWNLEPLKNSSTEHRTMLRKLARLYQDKKSWSLRIPLSCAFLWRLKTFVHLCRLATFSVYYQPWIGKLSCPSLDTYDQDD